MDPLHQLNQFQLVYHKELFWGPLLFLIYISDLNKCTKYPSIYHFADDTNMLQSNLLKLPPL